MKKILFVIDMQNDFIDGTLGSEDAKNIVPNVVELIKDFYENNSDSMIFYTLDTHNDEDYFNTLEGQKLPIKHCIENTYGHHLNADIQKLISKNFHLSKCFHKSSFGSCEMIDEASKYLWNNIKSNDEIFICGLCTDICVISNALLLRSKFPYLRITCFENLCAGTSKEAHYAAIKIMRSCQIDIATRCYMNASINTFKSNKEVVKSTLQLDVINTFKSNKEE